MVGYQAGSLDAFDRLHLALRRPLFDYLTALLGDRTRAEDLLQETFLQIHKARRTYTPSRPVRPWAFAIARHVYLMAKRSAFRRQRYEVGDPGELPEIPVPAEAAGLADREVVRAALVQLPPDRREALLLHHAMGFSFAEAGAILGVSEGAAKLRAHRAVQELRECLGRTGLGAAARRKDG